MRACKKQWLILKSTRARIEFSFLLAGLEPHTVVVFAGVCFDFHHHHGVAPVIFGRGQVRSGNSSISTMDSSMNRNLRRKREKRSEASRTLARSLRNAAAYAVFAIAVGRVSRTHRARWSRNRAATLVVFFGTRIVISCSTFTLTKENILLFVEVQYNLQRLSLIFSRRISSKFATLLGLFHSGT